MKDKIITIVFLVLVFGLFILNIVIPKSSVSVYERRYLESFPKFKIGNVLNGKYFKDLDNYLNDNFVFRDFFRKINVFYTFKVINKSDYKDYFINGDYIFKRERLNEESVNSFVDKMNSIYDKYLLDSNVYYSIIPDKSYYLDDYDKSNYKEISNIVSDRLNKNIKNIEISNDLSLDSYYYSDIHWRLEKLNNVSDTITKALGVNNYDYYEIDYYDKFYGGYYSNLSGYGKIDSIYYVNNSFIEELDVHDIEGKINKIYTPDSVKYDGYDFFLGGASPIIKIANKNSDSSRNLIIFRDSFGSSIAPLLTCSYNSVTLIDLRYIDSNLVSQYVDFKDSDVLLLYNTTLINNSDIIK